MEFTPHPDFIERAKLFTDNYQLVDFIAEGDIRFQRENLIPKTDRVCRFCNRTYNETTFKKDAHLVSKFMSNGDLFSDFECDDCNGKFSKYETFLSYYLGISRSIFGLSENRKPPSLVGKQLSLKSRSIVGQDFLILSKTDINEQNSKEDQKLGKIKFTYTKSSYIPLDVHKALTKAALLILPASEAIHYEKALQYLKDELFVTGVIILAPVAEESN